MPGKFEVTALSDVTFALQADQLLTNTTPDRVASLLARAYLKTPVETSVNGNLVNTGSKPVLIDAGAAKKGYYVALAHVSLPGIGKLRADGSGYQWVPANYSSAP